MLHVKAKTPDSKSCPVRVIALRDNDLTRHERSLHLLLLCDGLQMLCRAANGCRITSLVASGRVLIDPLLHHQRNVSTWLVVAMATTCTDTELQTQNTSQVYPHSIIIKINTDSEGAFQNSYTLVVFYCTVQILLCNSYLYIYIYIFICMHVNGDTFVH